MQFVQFVQAHSRSLFGTAFLLTGTSDAAEELFTRHDPGSVGMNEIAKAAGCSRATLYRYFENREALYTAYVHRESYRLFHVWNPMMVFAQMNEGLSVTARAAASAAATASLL